MNCLFCSYTETIKRRKGYFQIGQTLMKIHSDYLNIIILSLISYNDSVECLGQTDIHWGTEYRFYGLAEVLEQFETI